MMTATPRAGFRERVQGAPLPKKILVRPCTPASDIQGVIIKNLCGHACQGEKNNFKQ